MLLYVILAAAVISNAIIYLKIKEAEYGIR